MKEVKINLDFLFFLLEFLFGYLSSVVLHWIFEEIILYILLTCATMNSDVWCNTCSIQTYVIKHINILWEWGKGGVGDVACFRRILCFSSLRKQRPYFFSRTNLWKQIIILTWMMQKIKKSDLAVFNEKFLSNLKKKIPILMSRNILKKNLGCRKTKLHTKS